MRLLALWAAILPFVRAYSHPRRSFVLSSLSLSLFDDSKSKSVPKSTMGECYKQVTTTTTTTMMMKCLLGRHELLV